MTQHPTPETLESVLLDGEPFYRIPHVDAMRPFFMSIVSDANHWMFISSNGGLTAGRKNADYALFPYYTDDKITESADITGSKTIFQVRKGHKMHIWEPFSERQVGTFDIRRNLYKNKYSNKILFEEINADLGLVFQYQWNVGNAFGFVKKCTLRNVSDEPLDITLLDGIQNIVPYGVGGELQNRVSNLVDAYKRSELDPASGLGIFALSAIIVDKAEPSEALKANIAFCVGLRNPTYLLSSLQLKDFRQGGSVRQEEDVKGEKGAYYVQQRVELAAHTEQQWMMVADVNQNHSAVVRLIESIKTDAGLGERIRQDVDRGTENLIRLVAGADGLQCTEDTLNDSRHFSNVLFNIMRGGIFDENYQIDKADFIRYLQNAGRKVYADNADICRRLPDHFALPTLKSALANANDPDFIRLATEYLPLKFSRRHGDPSRPWNKFSINTQSDTDGAKILDYEGNWRDIFQNWEALAVSYPAFIEGMLFKFLNASTFDGYNPYRVTKDGFDWETIEHDDPWSYIGYWGDHQIIYLLKFLEFAENHYPGMLDGFFNKAYFVYAHIPYKIKPYEDICRHPKDTIDFDFELDKVIRARREKEGADGALLPDKNGHIVHVNFVEKILATLLAKLSNFILEGGIWMNTQRPEWNDANNALVGNGVSMVTLYYLNRFVLFFQQLLEKTALESVDVSQELADFLAKMRKVYADNLGLLQAVIRDEDRKKMLDGAGVAAGDFRRQVYEHSFTGQKQAVPIAELLRFAEHVRHFLAHTIAVNRREDHLYHGYHLMTSGEKAVSVEPLYEMLEGQVAALSACHLTAAESVGVLDALRKSAMYRADQHSYTLYPNKALPGFLEKNTVSAGRMAQYDRLKKYMDQGVPGILDKDIRGHYHFNGNFKNAADLQVALDATAHLSAGEKAELLALFEELFQHKAFTGRSGTFFGYEGLGSIYWHMVSKLRLAVQETVVQATETNENPEFVGRLLAHYYAITEGIGVHKSPNVYGAFPTDPYSHTPLGRGAQQPGMTGQVKEDILCRFGELGVFVRAGSLHFQPFMLRKQEFLTAPKTIACYDVQGNEQQITLPAGALFFTYGQVPVIYRLSEEEGLELVRADGSTHPSPGLRLTESDTRAIFDRSGEIRQINVWIKPARLWTP
ncbi:MAG: hypothetical protein SFV52_11705 [Saprospiraceae bacterium]|nr:hypothetical protein [Saprospiraceae bacterium]